SFSFALQPKVAKHRVEFAEVMRSKIDGDRGWTVDWISAQMSVCLNAALRQCNIEFAQVHGAVPLCIGGVDRACRRCLSGGDLAGRTKVQLGTDGYGPRIAVRPG